MKFLVDAQLPPSLAGWFVARGHEATHVAALPNGLRMPDSEIWQFAASQAFAIVSKDKDFLDLAAVRGVPPVVLLIGLGNAATRELFELLDEAWPMLFAELSRPEAGVVMFERGRVVVVHRG